MITKKQFCELIISNFCEKNKIQRGQLNESYITQSSALAVAMEYLGLISEPDNLLYAESRGGSIQAEHLFGYAEGDLSCRELLSLLPQQI